MAGKPSTERIVDIDKRIEQLKAQKQQLLARTKEKERKERTRRLITIGAILDKGGIKTIDQANAFLQEIENNPKVKDWFKSLMNQHYKEAEDKTEENNA